ncbi:MAG: helix-turn-helix transcriptional regulator [Actinobacteria bacterium]|nr:helix-turn-helix transcriptional regulator [Actinomycetota bacterium]
MREDTLEMSSASLLVPFLLLLMRERDSYGQDLMRRTADLGFGTTRPGTGYRTLRQMEKEGMVLSERDGFDCRLSRRKFSIIEAGEDYLEFWASSLAEYREDMDLFLEVYAGGNRVRGTQTREGIGRVPLEDTCPPVRALFSRFRGAGVRGAETVPGASEQAILPQRAVEEGR